MPYSVVQRDCTDSDGNDGGWVVIKDSDGEVMGCHQTRESAEDQIAAIEASENASAKAMEYKGASFSVKAASEDGTFEGYPSVFGNKDLGGDIVMPGAFKRTLDHNNGRFPLQVDHNLTIAARAGVVYAVEDDSGLFVRGHINMDKQLGRETHSDLVQAKKHDVPMGMSFGYSVVQKEHDKSRDARLLKEIKLYEVTLTQFPMNTAAGVTSVKEALQAADLTPRQVEYLVRQLKALLPDAGLAESGPDPHQQALRLKAEIDSINQQLETLSHER